MLLETVTEPDMLAIVKKLLARAKAGNLAAIKGLFDWTLGKPPQAVALTASDE